MATPPRPHAELMKVAYLLYPRFTALDVVGTFQVLAAAPGIESLFVAARVGAVIDDTGLCPLRASVTLDQLASADVVVVPGSECTCDPDPALVEWLRVVHPTTTWTLSVGTGSSYLAAAGALDGATAATHWASAQRLRDAGVTYSDQRVVRAGKVLTSAGATAGIDLALDPAGPQPRTGRRPDRAAGSRVRPPTPLRRRLPGEGARRDRRARELLLRTEVQLMSPTENLLLDTRPPQLTDQPRVRPPGPPVAAAASWRWSSGSAWSAVWLRARPPARRWGSLGHLLLGVLLLAAFQTLVRRRPLRTLLARDTASFARRWAGKLLVAAVLVLIPAAMVLLSVGGGRYGRYADDSWKALLMLVVLAGELPRHASPSPHRAHRRGHRRGRVLGPGPEPGSRPQRRPHGPGAPGPASQHGLAGRLPRRRRRRGRPGRGPAGAAGRHRRRRHHPDGGRVDDQGDDRPGHRRRRAPRRDPHGRARRPPTSRS